MQVKEKIRSLIADIAEISPGDIPDDVSFQDALEIDSMHVLEMLAELERAFKIHISEDELVEFTNLNGVARVVERHLAAVPAQ